MKKCGNAKKYKGIRAPQCDGGRGCDTCWEIFQKACDHNALHLQDSGTFYSCLRCRSTIFVDQVPVFKKVCELSELIRNLHAELYEVKSSLEPPDPMCE